MHTGPKQSAPPIRKCLAITKSWKRCRNTPGDRWLCTTHRRWPLTAGITGLVGLVTVLGSIATIHGIWGPSGRQTLPVHAAPQNPGFEVFSHHRRLDLGEWQYVPKELAEQKISACRWKDVLELRRTGSATQFTLRHATTGILTPDFSSVSRHPITYKETVEQPIGGPRLTNRIFDVTADVSAEPAGERFILEVDATYWNACNNLAEPWAAWPVTNPTEHGVFEIQFPSSRPFMSFERRRGARDNKKPDLVTDAAVEFASDNSFIRWRIDAPILNWVYMVLWEWKRY